MIPGLDIEKFICYFHTNAFRSSLIPNVLNSENLCKPFQSHYHPSCRDIISMQFSDDYIFRTFLYKTQRSIGLSQYVPVLQ